MGLQLNPYKIKWVLISTTDLSSKQIKQLQKLYPISFVFTPDLIAFHTTDKLLKERKNSIINQLKAMGIIGRLTVITDKQFGLGLTSFKDEWPKRTKKYSCFSGDICGKNNKFRIMFPVSKLQFKKAVEF